jgi:hypothetical protein
MSGANANASPNLNADANPPAAPYAICSYLDKHVVHVYQIGHSF